MTIKEGLVCPLVPLHPLPRMTADLPGCGGVIRSEVEDFAVEEVPAYEACGEGEHLYLWLEKRDLSGGQLKRILSRTLDISAGDIGMAGMKDRRAVTRQWISIPARHEAALEQLSDDRIKILATKRHGNKLRTGHLRGNRFVIRVRGVGDGSEEIARAKLDQLAVSGMPNFYGSQRMGIGGSTLATGWALASGARRTAVISMPDGTQHKVNLRDRMLRRLAASALQSELFNRVLQRRMDQGLLGTVMLGDVCTKRDTGGMFVSDDATRDQARMLNDELSVTGPMWGPKMRRATDDAGVWETAVMESIGLSEEHFAKIGSLAPGTRRKLRVWPTDVSAHEDEDGLVLRFTLPSGSFATVLLHEVCGPESTVKIAARSAVCA